MLLATGWKPPERFVSKGRDGKTDIYGIIIRPSNFDPRKEYPVIEKIYAGPQGAFVPKEFGLQTRERQIAELGFIIVQIDGMGTSYRSKAFHNVCWKNLGDAGFPDRIPWMKAAAEKYPYMDLTRVGIYGGSAGGQSALRALLAYGDFYKVAVADCGPGEVCIGNQCQSGVECIDVIRGKRPDMPVIAMTGSVEVRESAVERVLLGATTLREINKVTFVE